MRRGFAIIGLVTVALLVWGGCRKPRKFVRTKAQQERVDQAILDQAPDPRFKVGANFGDRIRLIGLDVTPANPPVGGKIVVDFYWEVLEPIEAEGDWKIFVHIEGPTEQGRPARVIADHYAVEDGPGGVGLYPPKEWKKGQIIKDSKTVDLVDPRGQKVGPGEVKIYAGVFDAEAWDKRQENIRLEVKNEADVKSGDNRVEAATFTVGDPKTRAQAKPFKAPTLQVRRAVAPITIDGELDDAAWQAAAITPTLARPDGKPLGAPMRTQVRALWDDEAVYFGWTVADGDPKSKYSQRDEELWNEDVVEVYLDPGADGKDYLELQVSPKNVIFDALFTSRRTPDWKEARKFNLANLKTAVHTGTLPGTNTPGWTVEIRIPWADLASAKGGKPDMGARWKANFFRKDHPGDFSRLAAWSAVSDDARADFHNLDRAGFLVFTDTPEALKKRVMGTEAPKPQVAPAAEAPAGEAAPEAEAAPEPTEGSAAPEAPKAVPIPSPATPPIQ